MAPTPTEDKSLVADPTSTAAPHEGYWTKANIGVTIVFGLLALAICLLLLLFLLRRRSEKKKEARRKSDRAGLLAHEDKTNMFSKERHSSVTLYLDTESEAQSKQISRESMSLVPLQVTPLEEAHDPIGRTDTTTASNGSGVSALSRLSYNTASTMMLSPISPNAEEGDLSVRPSGRPRSTSTASQKARYYDTTPMNVDMPPIPTIIRTRSD
ncbi:hypothetical protein CC86DRAFT_1701 [Ophiobolus disseminans]|uniref:Uncharacterized protein n=1 Tax=Ophiobolus disseminans TaxID=1469910 RepID=A0A6A7AJQ7_9PLEO|nr:hypothetical protein CC86DRAFT_1701 [Ophiobolus disseminans]